jgi:hypothetical protein
VSRQVHGKRPETVDGHGTEDGKGEPFGWERVADILRIGQPGKLGLGADVALQARVIRTGAVLSLSNRAFQECIWIVLVVISTTIVTTILADRKLIGCGCFGRRKTTDSSEKLLSDMLDYMGESGQKVEDCRSIVARLLNGTSLEYLAFRRPNNGLEVRVAHFVEMKK